MASRRARLIEACTELMGVAGVAGISMRSVCREAALTERYFYESFTNIDQLMITVLEIVVLDARGALLSALATAQTSTPDLVRLGVDAFTDYLMTDPRRGRIMFIESQVSPVLATRAIALIEQFVGPIVRSIGVRNIAATEHDAVDVRLNAVAIFGALAFLYRRRVTEGPAVDRERFAEHAAQVIEPIALARSSRIGSGAERDR
ncbi:TetR/AcrR family transcriptional regulator [Nocardia sp. NBC_01009]|uniref:TetR/AcrR family transcriptional regulator n=1 Tax=Nocardia sp. NBC_01009 TaxID=2975996 RepID=UPI00386C25F8|nr:TetR/AcrR family transcriptional regulator [Nocardia sp. NBC_01009]